MAASDHLEVRDRGNGDIQFKLGNRDLTPALRSVDIYFRADQTPEVVLRPVVTEWGTTLEGPRVTISADVALILEHAGWVSPERARTMTDNDAVVMLEQERDHYRDQAKELQEAQEKLAAMEEDLANTHGQLEDLKLANQTLHDELEAAQRGNPPVTPQCLGCDLGIHAVTDH
jgi:hypothetical protein